MARTQVGFKSAILPVSENEKIHYENFPKELAKTKFTNLESDKFG